MYSNCLFEAIKAKLKDPKNIEIHLIPPSINNHDLHFYWKNKEENRIYHFTTKKNNFWDRLNIFIFKGNFKTMKEIFFEELLYRKMKKAGWPKKKQIKYAKKLNFERIEPFEFDRN